ncbi:hypothetical protein D1641_05915 [Colidextribacter sp. OB.20]|uniref:InlB B-repeat-containing protein n=1 Tax=Colidextribacter sp. OB.20 TaxID=2304568 RepID=UPI00136E57B3|nr:InlB B-repeat-containing protein [Colidextribacter sp. OB.20]NBI09558.1 hypothetical protein [Colidextribacter sp. OB.20]
MMKKRIVSTILALCLLLPALPVSARAEEPAGSTPGERGKSLAELFQEDGTIELSGDETVSETLVVPAGKTVVLDLKGFTINSTASPAIKVAGRLTVKDSTAGDPPLVDDKNAVTYNSGRLICSSDGIHAQEGGTVDFLSGKVESNRIGIAAIGNKTGTGDPVRSSVNIQNGYVEAVETAVAVHGSGAWLNVTGGVLLSKDNAVIAGNGTNNYGGTSIAMHGGTLIGKITTPGYIPCGIYHPQDGELMVGGGEIRADGGVGILMRGGIAYIEKDVKITATGSGSGKVGYAEQGIEAGKQIALDQKSGYYDGNNIRIVVTNSEDDDRVPAAYCSDGYSIQAEEEEGFVRYYVKPTDSPEKCVVHFDLNYDTDLKNPADQEAVCGETLLKMGRPTCDRGDKEYDFLGWYKEPECINKWDFDIDKVERDTTLYAKWKKTRIDVIFYANGGLIKNASENQTSTIHKNAAGVKLTTIAEWAGHEFLGWFDDPVNGVKYESGQSCDFKKDTYLYAHWAGEPTADALYTVTIDRNYDGAPDPTYRYGVKVGGKVEKPADPARPRGHHTFLGWYKDAEFKEPWNFDTDTVTADVFLYAKWEDSKAPVVTEKFTVTFDSQDGSAVDSQEIEKGGKATKPDDPAKDGYTFGGWYREAACENAWDFDNDTVTGNITLYAKWEDSTVDSEKFTVTFDSQDGSAVDSQEIEKDGKVREPSQPTRTGYTFGGWYREAACETAWDLDNDTVTEDITLYAKWTERSGGDTEEDKTYTITFKLEYAGAEDVIKTTGKDGKLTDWPADPTREGYSFDGWYTASTGGEKAPDAFSSDTTLYAHWTKDDDPDETRYRIYTPGSVSGGSYDVSRSSATQGTRITIEFTPRSGYDLDYLTVTNRSTGEDVPLTERYSDEYYFTMPDSSVDVDIAFSRERPGNVYFDLVPPQAKPGPTAWYYMNRHIYHITDGMVPDSTPITRDMLISVLYNLTDESLLNVPGAIGSETNNAHAWAVSSGVMPDIYASGLWGMDKSLSREQLALMVFQYARYRGHSTYQGVELSHYADSRQLRTIAQDAMSWSLATGLLSPVSGTTISPKGTITCGQTGELFYRYQTTIA